MIEAAIYARLVTASGVPVFPHVIPPSTNPPALTYRIDSDLAPMMLDGAEGTLREALISVNAWATTQVAAHALADSIESSLIGFAGDLGAVSPAITADHIRLERKFDLFENQTKLYRVSLQFFIAYC